MFWIKVLKTSFILMFFQIDGNKVIKNFFYKEKTLIKAVWSSKKWLTKYN